MRLIAILVVSTFAACGSGKAAGVASPSNAPAPQVSAIELAEITMFEGADAMLKIHADGSTELGTRSGRLRLQPGVPASSSSLPITWRRGPTIKPDGTVHADGHDVGRINADGTVVILATNEKLPATIEDRKLTVVREDGFTSFLEIGAGGLVMVTKGDAPPKPQGRIEGADTPGKRRMVLGFIAMMFLGANSSVTVTTETTDSEPAMP